MNEGIGKVLRFGAYSKEVVDRLLWMKDVLGPTLGRAIRSIGGLNVNPLVAKAIAMGRRVPPEEYCGVPGFPERGQPGDYQDGYGRKGPI